MFIVTVLLFKRKKHSKSSKTVSKTINKTINKTSKKYGKTSKNTLNKVNTNVEQHGDMAQHVCSFPDSSVLKSMAHTTVITYIKQR